MDLSKPDGTILPTCYELFGRWDPGAGFPRFRVCALRIAPVGLALGDRAVARTRCALMCCVERHRHATGLRGRTSAPGFCV